jgi:uncharacterized protein
MRGVTRFFVLTYAMTWTCFLASALVLRTPAIASLRWPLLLIGAFAPSLVAVWLTARDDGRAGVRALLRRLLQWNVGARWYAFALGYMLVVKAAVAVTYRLAFGVWPSIGAQPWYQLLLLVVVAGIIGGPLGEEVGWRGYALPRLADRYGMARASVLLGVVWALWHLPLFFLPGGDQLGQAIVPYVLRVIGMSVAIAWLYQHSNGSLLLAVLMHSAINQSKDIVPSAVPGATDPFALHASATAWLTTLVVWLVAAYLLVRMSRARVVAPLAPAPAA